MILAARSRASSTFPGGCFRLLLTLVALRAPE
jgi:hypothetical protein